MRDAVICEPIRTPVGRFGGVFRDVSAAQLAAVAVRALLDRTGVEPSLIDDVILGQCYPGGESPAIGRIAALDAGLPVTVTGMQMDRRCGSGLQAVIQAIMQVQTGASDMIIAGGVESMSHAEFYSTSVRWGVHSDAITFHDRLARARVTAGGANYPVPGGMIETAENLRREFGISRQRQDELAATSHARAVAAQLNGNFADEIIDVVVPSREGDQVISTDEHPRPETTVESLSKLRPIMGRVDSEATVTAGNASGQNDGASVCIVTHADLARELGLKPIARLLSWALAGVEPARMGIGPVASTAKALERAHLSISDINLIELNEAFAAQVLAVTASWNFTDKDFERLNVNGSGISLGHPVGATGCRIMTTLLREMHRREVSFGLETMCIGGGQGLAAIFESFNLEEL
jgi:acetyl-CoA C-acetyltransferase